MNNEEKVLDVLAQMQEQMTQMQEQMTQMQGDISSLKTDVSGIKVRLDIDVDHKLSLLAEGHGLLVERLDSLADVKDLAEETKAKVDVIYDVVSQHSVDIKAIKNSTILPFPKDKTK